MIIRYDREDIDYVSYTTHFSSSCYLDTPQKVKGVGTLIHPSWVLTAAHAAKSLNDSHNVVFKDETPYLVKEIIYHPSWLLNTARPARDTIKDVADLALIRLATPVENLTPFRLDKLGSVVGDELTFVGNGAFGNGLTGNQGWDNQWRAATNRVEEVLYDQWLVFRFDEHGKTKLEGITGTGDSGGPALIQREGQWLLTGVASWGDSSQASSPNAYGSVKYYVSLHYCLEWIDAVIQDK